MHIFVSLLIVKLNVQNNSLCIIAKGVILKQNCVKDDESNKDRGGYK